MKKRWGALLSLLALLLFLTGCDGRASMEKPMDPALRSIRAQLSLQFLFNGAAFTTPDNLPSERCVRLDLDLDGEDEYVAFLTLTRGGERRAEVVVYKNVDGDLVKLGAIENTCDAISDFLPVRLSETVQAMVIGWSLDGGENRGVSVCTLSGDTIDTLYGGHYSAISVSDFDRDGCDEILLARAEASDARGSAVLLDYSGDALSPVSRVALSQGLRSFSHVQTAPIGFEQTAMICEGYIDGLGYVSDYIVCLGGKLLNVFLSDYTGVSTPTLRRFPLWSADVDGNGYVELPVIRGEVQESAAASAPNSICLVDWMQCGGTGMTSVICTTCHDFENEWYLILPKLMDENLAVDVSLDTADCTGVLFSYISDTGERQVPVWEIFIARTEEAGKRLQRLGMDELDAVYPDSFYLVHYRNVYGFSYSRRTLAAAFHTCGAPELPEELRDLFSFHE